MSRAGHQEATHSDGRNKQPQRSARQDEPHSHRVTGFPSATWTRVLPFEARRVEAEASVDSAAVPENGNGDLSSSEIDRLFQAAFNLSTQPMSLTTFDEGRYVDVNAAFLAALGFRRSEVVGRTSLELGIWHRPSARDELLKSLNRKKRVANLETQVCEKSGKVRNWNTSAQVVELGGEKYILAVAADSTQHKEAEEKLRDLSSRLIRAQEEERSRIARELHDDLNQRLALFSIELELLGQDPLPEADDLKKRIRALFMHAQEVSADVHRLSYQLHPAKLDHLGLTATVRSLCLEITRLRSHNIEFFDRDVPNAIPREVALNIFRTAQEALRNVVRHSNTTSARVELTCKAGILRLRVTDTGDGFNLKTARAKGGLGLISMEERLRLVGGKLVIRSRPSRGTQVEARVPISECE